MPLSSVLSRADLADLGCGVPAICPFPVLSSAFSGAIRRMTLVNAVLFFRKKSGFVIFSEAFLPVPSPRDAFFRRKTVVPAPFFMFFFHVTICLSARRGKSEFFLKKKLSKVFDGKEKVVPLHSQNTGNGADEK